MITITKEAIKQLEKEYGKEFYSVGNDCSMDKGFIEGMEDHFVGLHVDEKEALDVFKACYGLYLKGFYDFEGG